MEDVPRVEAQSRPQLHRHAGAVERQAPEQLREAPGGGGGDGQGTEVDDGHESILSDVARRTRANVPQWPGHGFTGRLGRGCAASSTLGSANAAERSRIRGWMRRVAAVAALVLGLLAFSSATASAEPRSGHRPRSPTRRGPSPPTAAAVQAALDRLTPREPAPVRRLRPELLRARRSGLGGPLRPGVAARPARRTAGRRDRRPGLRHLARRDAPAVRRPPRRTSRPATSARGWPRTTGPAPRSRWPTGCVPARRGRLGGGRVAGPCRSGSSSAGSRWSAAGPTCWRAAGVAGARAGPGRGRAGAPPRPPTPPRRDHRRSRLPRQHRAHRARRRRADLRARARPRPQRRSATRPSRSSAPRWSSSHRAGAGLRAAPAHRRREARRRHPPRPPQPDPAPVRHRGPAARRPVGRLRPPARPRAEPAPGARRPEAEADRDGRPGPGTTAARRRVARPLRGVRAGAGRRQHHAGHGPARRRPHRDRGGRHRARGRQARRRGGVGAGRRGGDRDRPARCSTGSDGSPTSWPRRRTGCSRRAPRSRQDLAEARPARAPSSRGGRACGGGADRPPERGRRRSRRRSPRRPAPPRRGRNRPQRGLGRGAPGLRARRAGRRAAGPDAARGTVGDRGGVGLHRDAPGAVGSDARTRLAEAQRHLDTAAGLAQPARWTRCARRSRPTPGPGGAGAGPRRRAALVAAARRRRASGIDLGSLVLGGILLGARRGSAAGTAAAAAAGTAGAVASRWGLLARQLRRLGHPRPRVAGAAASRRLRPALRSHGADFAGQQRCVAGSRSAVEGATDDFRRRAQTTVPPA